MPLEPRKIINTANSFMLAAARSYERRPLNDQQVQMLIIPAIVCQAFAVELYLKAILVLEEKESRGHDLTQLFSILSEHSQREIRRLVADAAFDRNLVEASNAFTEWRYIFESDGANATPQFLEAIAGAAQSVAEGMLQMSED